MDFFSDSLDRLKHYLRVSKDQEVALALGMSKTAFSERKKRGSFPEKELRALAQHRPDLKIDVDYVLTGGLPGPNVAVALGKNPRALMGPNVDVALGRDPAAVAGPVAMVQAAGAQTGQALQGDEARLLAAFRAADSAGRAAILLAAKGIAALAQD